jgi:hypothetical protein
MSASGANGCNGDGASHRNISPRLLAIEKSRSIKVLRLSVPPSSREWSLRGDARTETP